MNCEEIKKKLGIRSVMESFNLFPVKENRNTAFYFALDREEKIPSLSVDFIKNRAFDFGTGKSYDVISVVQQIRKCSVSEALKYLETFDFSVQNISCNDTNFQQFYEILEIGEIRHTALKKYLGSRKVISQKHLVKEVHYKLNGKKYFGIGFENNSGGYEIRNMYTKICLGAKDITLIKNENNLSNEIAVFEGFFDYLTFRNLDKSECDCLIMNSTAMLFKTEKILEEYRKIFLFLDNDESGRAVATKVKSQYDNVEDCSVMYSNSKDVNDWFCNYSNDFP